MLSPADRAVADRDRAIAGLPVLLDSSAMRDVLRSVSPAGTVESVVARYVRYKPGTSLLVAYDAVVDGRREFLHAKAYRTAPTSERPPKANKGWRHGSSVPGLGFTQVWLVDLAVDISAFPSDRRVRHLGALAIEASRYAVLSRLMPTRPELWDARLQPLSYKPERRFVGALMVGTQPEAVLRVHAPRTDVPRIRGLSPGLRVPDLLARSSWRGVAVTSWIDGTPLDQLAIRGAAREHGGDVGQTIAQLHASAAPALPVRSPVDERLAIASAAASVCDVLPALGPTALDLARRLADRARPAIQPVTLHGDLHVGQVLIGPLGPSLIDLDDACRGAAASDLGSVLASLLADAAAGRLPMTDALALCDGIVDGYARAAGSVPIDLDQWVAVHLLRRAPHAFRQRHEFWPDVTAALLTLARHAVDAPRWRGSEHARGTAHDADAALPGLAAALQPRRVEVALSSHPDPRWRHVRVRDARLVRHKVGRRCLIEYDVVGLRPHGDAVQTVIGKMRSRGVDARTATLMARLWAGDFAPDSAHGASVPQPLAVVPDLAMWLQERVPGTPATEWAFTADALPRMRHAAAALRRLHTSAIDTQRFHDAAAEIDILRQRLTRLAEVRPDLAQRSADVFDGVVAELVAQPPAPAVLLHRDLHPDHLIWHESRLYLIDFDLAAHGDAGVDVGNLAAHLLELGLRVDGDLDRLRPVADAFVLTYLQTARDVSVRAVETWTTVALARLAALSVTLPGRSATTEALIACCEHRLAATRVSRRADAYAPTETWS